MQDLAEEKHRSRSQWKSYEVIALTAAALLTIAALIFLLGCAVGDAARSISKDFHTITIAATNSIAAVAASATGVTEAVSRRVDLSTKNKEDWHQRLTDFWEQVWPYLLGAIAVFFGFSKHSVPSLTKKLLGKENNEKNPRG